MHRVGAPVAFGIFSTTADSTVKFLYQCKNNIYYSTKDTTDVSNVVLTHAASRNKNFAEINESKTVKNNDLK